MLPKLNISKIVFPYSVPERFMPGVLRVSQNKYIKSNSEIVRQDGKAHPSIQCIVRNTWEYSHCFWMRSVFTCTCSFHFLLCSHLQQECHRDLLFYPAELKVMLCSWSLISSLCKESALMSRALGTLECKHHWILPHLFYLLRMWIPTSKSRKHMCAILFCKWVIRYVTGLKAL